MNKITTPAIPPYFVSARAVSEHKAENAQQGKAVLFDHETSDPLAVTKFKLIEGEQTGFVNLTDIDNILRTLTHVAAGFHLNFGVVPCIAIGVKHGNACGASFGNDPTEVLENMLEGSLSAIFGGFVITNFNIYAEEAGTLLHHKLDPGVKRRKLDGIIAPNFAPLAIDVLKARDPKNTPRLLTNPRLEDLTFEDLNPEPIIRQLRGAHLVQRNYNFVPDLAEDNVNLVLSGEPLTDEQKMDLLLAYGICVTSTSNTITVVRNGMLIGNAVGQQSRVEAAQLAIHHAETNRHWTKGAVAWSDSFFPFPDGPEVLLDAGIETVFATSGSIRDDLTIQLFQGRKKTFLTLPDSMARGFCRH
jgi:phosphoribosylaminoimidazolecarboxamide formyltransferase / IMP cyclohydrolase